ncbi:uncharacterized protein LOC6564053 isoform X3 [Drosophila grimshawi]|uniref:uncharacterized protein LOC6564053 isoform X3 n=1 Tax=Drosophila grimshawi TaxID=7222 RepID=UPI000C86F68A|nr:uncharacterized protein LOC6564053 isoform X3 [Drosophila grimshawi]
MREPRDNDIGLMFDVTVCNNDKNDIDSDMLELTVNSNGICTLNLPNGEQVEAGTIFGGDLTTIEPGKSVTVSLVLPTESVYNRVGSCPIAIWSMNHENGRMDQISQILHFDTRFETLDPSAQSLRRRTDFVDCNNWDKDYLRNCTPVDCEERYFGQRSFYNRITEHCEPTPASSSSGDMQYNYYANECVETQTVITEKKIEQPETSTESYNIFELHPYGGMRRNLHIIEHHTNTDTVTNNKMEIMNLSHVLHTQKHHGNVSTSTEKKMEIANSSQVHLPYAKINTSATRKLKKKMSPKSELRNFYYAWYMPLNAESNLGKDNNNNNNNSVDGGDTSSTSSGPDSSNTIDVDPDHTLENINNSNSGSVMGTSQSNNFRHLLASYSAMEWLIMAMEMLLLIIITLLIYTVVCICLYILLEIIGEIKTKKASSSHLGKKMMPRHRKDINYVTTSASLLSLLK